MPIKKDVDLNRIAEMTEGFSRADVSSVANTALSLVLHDHIQKYPSPEEALRCHKKGKRTKRNETRRENEFISF